MTPCSAANKAFTPLEAQVLFEYLKLSQHMKRVRPSLLFSRSAGPYTLTRR